MFVQSGHKENGIPPLPPDNHRREEYLTAYISLVGKVNSAMNSRLWWATDFSSKNRFRTRLPHFLYDMIRIGEGANSETGAALLAESAPWQIRRSLIKHFARSGVQVKQRFVSGALRDIILEFLKRLGGGFYHLFRLMFRHFYARLALRRKIQAVLGDQSAVYIIKTFVYDHSFAGDGSYQDVFFGPLPEYLTKNGKRIVFFADILGNFRDCMTKIAACPNAVILPIDYFGSLKDILKSVCESIFYRPKVAGDFYFGDYEVSDLINSDLSSGSGRIQPYQLLQYAQAGHLLAKIPVQCFLQTYENNPWEKMCIKAVRKNSPGTKILSYQHTVNPQASVNIYQGREDEKIAPLVDKVFTLGEISAEIIRTYSLSTGPSVEPACALQFAHLWKMSPYPRTRTKRILVATEGIMKASCLINYVLGQLKDSTEYEVIFRAHPVLPIRAMSSRFLFPLKDRPHFAESCGYSLQRDIERTDLMIYWGSMASLEALWMGKPLIHFDMDTLFSYDPLFNVSHLKWVVSEKDDLQKTLEEIYALSDAEYARRFDAAQIYLRRYFREVSEENMSKFLDDGTAFLGQGHLKGNIFH